MLGGAGQTDSAIILAGGENSRMASPKAFLKVGGAPIIVRQIEALKGLFGEIIVVTNDPGQYAGLGVRAIPDAPPFGEHGVPQGPMAGIYTGLTQMRGGYGFVLACDMPFIRPALVSWMSGLKEGHEAVLPKIGGYVEPLFGFYSKGLAGVMARVLGSGVRSVQKALEGRDVKYVSGEEMRGFDPELLSVVNLNTPEDLETARRLLSGWDSGL